MNAVFLLFAGAWLILVVGVYGLLLAHDLIRVVIALQIMVKGAVLLLVIAGRLNGNLALGQSLGITVILADTMAAVIGLALAVKIKTRFGSISLDSLIHTEV